MRDIYVKKIPTRMSARISRARFSFMQALKMDRANSNGTLLQRRRRSIKVGKEETLLILRGYLAQPTNWSDVLDDIRQNLYHLPEEARHLYNTGSARQIRDRMSNKLGNRVKKRPRDIQDADIRSAIVDIQNMERRLIDAREQSADRQPVAEPQEPEVDRQAVAEPQQDDIVRQPLHVLDPQPGPSNDRRDEAAAALSSDDENISPVREQGRARLGRRRTRKRPLADLIRENHELYNDFIKHKIPRLLRQLGVNSSDESTDSE